MLGAIRYRAGLLSALVAISLACAAPQPERATKPEPKPPTPAPSLVEGGRKPAPAVTSELEVSDGTDGTDPAAAATTPSPWIAGEVAGAAIDAADILIEWHQLAGRELWLMVDKLVATRLAFAEASRLGIRLAPEAVELRVDEERQRFMEGLAESRPDMTVDEFLRTEMRQEPERYFELLRRGTIRQMVAERGVRSWTLANESVRLRLIVVPDATEMEQVIALLGEGEDFGDLAREYSVDDSAGTGGLVPFVVRQETSPLARVAFTTPPGEIGGPLSAAGHECLVLVEELRAPQAGNWSVIGESVEASLARFPVTDTEFLHWRIQMEKRYPVDLSPLMDLLGTSR